MYIWSAHAQVASSLAFGSWQTASGTLPPPTGLVWTGLTIEIFFYFNYFYGSDTLSEND